jgi:pilus assembly protein Flp/PilA
MKKGQGLVEYALVLVLVAVVVIVVLAILGPLLKNIFNPQPPVPLTQLDRNAYWTEVVPPPNFTGRCWKYDEGAAQSRTMSIWCVHNSEM